MATRSIDCEFYFYLREEGLVVSKVGSRIKFQAPNHLSPIVLGQVGKDFRERRSFLDTPICDTTVAVGQSCCRRRGTEGFNEGEGHGEVRGRTASDLVQDMASYGIARQIYASERSGILSHIECLKSAQSES